MAQILRVHDVADERLHDYTSLRDMSLRKRLEGERGLYLAEGEKVVRRAVQSGHEPFSFLMAPRWLDGLSDVLATTDAPCFVLDEKAIELLTGFHVHRGALAAMRRPDPRTLTSILEPARRLLVLEELADHSNVGAIFRTAYALGFDGIALSPRCADPLYRRAIKVSMGAVFQLPYAWVDDWYSFPELLRNSGFTSLAMTLAPDAVSLTALPELGEKIAVIFGGEGHGLSSRWQSGSDYRVMIPMRADIDSLNVAASVAVTCWQLRM